MARSTTRQRHSLTALVRVTGPAVRHRASRRAGAAPDRLGRRAQPVRRRRRRRHAPRLVRSRLTVRAASNTELASRARRVERHCAPSPTTTSSPTRRPRGEPRDAPVRHRRSQDRLGRRRRALGGDPDDRLGRALVSSIEALLRGLRTAGLTAGDPLTRAEMQRTLRRRIDPLASRARAPQPRPPRRTPRPRHPQHGRTRPRSTPPGATSTSTVRSIGPTTSPAGLDSPFRPPGSNRSCLRGGVTQVDDGHPHAGLCAPVPSADRARPREARVRRRHEGPEGPPHRRPPPPRHPVAARPRGRARRRVRRDRLRRPRHACSAADLDELDEHCEIIEQLARESGMELRCLDGRQDVAWAAALPLGLAPEHLLA